MASQAKDIHPITTQSVALQQQALVAEILSKKPSNTTFDVKGLAIYRGNLRATAKSALAITFPTVEKLIGDELMGYAAEQLLYQSPPQQGDWGEWGQGFSQLLSELQALDDYPYVPYSAELDWHVHQIERGQDHVFNWCSLQLLREVELDQLKIKFPSTTRVLHSPFPVMEIWHSNHSNNPIKYIEAFKRRMATDKPSQCILLFRQAYKANFIELTDIEKAWLELLMEGCSIGQALDSIEQTFNQSFDFEHWLPLAVEQNIIAELTIAAPIN